MAGRSLRGAGDALGLNEEMALPWEWRLGVPFESAAWARSGSSATTALKGPAPRMAKWAIGDARCEFPRVAGSHTSAIVSHDVWMREPR